MLTILRQQVIRAADDELGDEAAQFLELLLAFCSSCVCGVGVAATNDGVLEVLPKVVLGTKEIWVGEIQQRKVL